MNKGKLIAVDTPNQVKNSMGKQVVEIVCSPIRDAYKIIKEKSGYEVQIFGDRINVVVDNFEKDYEKLETLLKESNICIIDKRLITPTLENVFIHLIKEAS
jgi:ABC-2 type transport system ATP-binding protein